MDAPQLHQQAIIFDGHNDSLMLKLERGDPLDFGPDNPAYHVDLSRLKQSGLTAFNNYVGARDLSVSLTLWEALYWHLEAYPDDFLLAKDAGDVRLAKAEGKTAFVGQLESCACLGERLGALRLQHRLGLRVANLSHGEGKDKHESALQVDSSLFDYTTAEQRETARREMGGLTDFGREVVRACNDLGIVIDTAHANDRTFYEAVELSEKPCIFSHGCVFAISPHWRGLTDDQIKLLAAKGGVMGVAFYTKFIHPEAPSMDKLMDQVAHVVDLVGPDHIGFGSDFDGLPKEEIPIPPHQGRLIEFTEALVKRGFDEETVLKILGGNFLRVFERVCG
jgi:membrane dipeptidase